MTAITTKQKPVHVCSDGEEFDDCTAAIEHQAVVDETDTILAYITDRHAEAKPRYQNSLKRQLADFIKFRATRTADEKPPAKK